MSVYYIPQSLGYLLLLLLLLLSRPPGSVTFVIKVPTDYMALQGHLIVYLLFPIEENNERTNPSGSNSNKISQDTFRKIYKSPLEESQENQTDSADSRQNSPEPFTNLFESGQKSSTNQRSTFDDSDDSLGKSIARQGNHRNSFGNKIQNTLLLKSLNMLNSEIGNGTHPNLQSRNDVIRSSLVNRRFIRKRSLTKDEIRNRRSFRGSSSSPFLSSSTLPSSSMLDPSSFSSTTAASLSPMFISLYVVHQSKPLMRLKVPEEGSQITFTFPCGTVLNGGLHIVRLKRNKKILAESPTFNVSWPQMVIDIPIRLETYRSPADVQFSFIKAHSCTVNKPKAFKTWAELLYHGSDSPRILPTRLPTSELRDQFDASEEERSRRSFVASSAERSLDATESSTNGNTTNSELKVPRSVNIYNSDKKYIDAIDGTQSLVQHHLSWLINGSLSGIPLTSRPKRMYTLSSLEGSTIPSKSNSNIRPEALKMWSWEDRFDAQVVQRVPVVGDLYSQAEFNVRFNCEVVGPAGLYSVRVVTDIPSSPVIAESNTFPVEWAEEFTLHIQRFNLIPCLSPVLVTYTRPLCVGKQEKIRLYAQMRANVTSSNPPIYQRYVTERRATNYSTYFDCDLFTDEPTEYCFVYVNTATSGAVSVARSQCVATFKPGVLRVDGEWGEWSHWTDCTTTCGSGTKIRHRFCNNPAPRNGGLFCRGSSLSTSICGDPTCIPKVPLDPIPSSALPTLGPDNECICGCHIVLEKDFELTLSPSAADCSGTSTWIFEVPICNASSLQSPSRTFITVELLRVALLPGFQWLKIRDGNSSSSPLLLALPSFRTLTTNKVPERVSSTEGLLLVVFRSDVNSSYVGNVWGFRLKVWASTSMTRRLVWPALEVTIKRSLAAFHVVVMILGSCVLVAITGYLAYYCRRYKVYKKSKLVLDDSPMETPNGSPNQERRRDRFSSVASVATFTEVLSMKSLKLNLRKSSSSSYTRLARDGDFGYKGLGTALRSLPASPLLSSLSRLPLSIRRSSTQLTRILKMGNRKKINRRSASFDHLRTNISPIDEDCSLHFPNSLTMEQLSNNKNTEDKRVYIEMEMKSKEVQEKGKGEEHSDKYKEHRKSLLMSKELCDKVAKLPKTVSTSKLSKDKVNQEKANKERLNRRENTSKEVAKDNVSCSSGEGTVRQSTSVSQLSMASGIDMEMELDYYDYDVGNASAVPGSLFGMDPTLMPWMIDIDELDIKSPDELTGEANRRTPDHDITPRIEEIQLQVLNIPPSCPDPLQISSTSNESNGSPDIDRLRVSGNSSKGGEGEEDDEDDLTPRAEDGLTLKALEDGTPDVSEENIKILNIHDAEDFQFADDSADEDEDVIYNK